MEGDGEGLVAIVQGLDTSGVTLTVCNRARHNSDRRRSSRHRIQINTGNTRPADMPATDHRSNMLPASSAMLANQRSSVETSTGTDFARQHTSSQICDGRYASSYRLAHCMVTPTSPPEAVSEFPPQRREPCRNQGNFEIGGRGSGHSSGKVRVSSSRARHYGGSQTWGDKGSSHRCCKSNRDTEAFVHSLRKYPSMAPFRTASTDLIEKLIRYTQAKNFEEMSRSSRSMRSLRQQKSSDTYEMARASKHQQTYTRRQDNNAVNKSNVQVGYKGRARNYKLYSPMSDSRNLKENRHRETTFSSSYDYLKAGLSPYGRNNRSDESPSPVGSSSPERTMSRERSRSPDRLKSPEVNRSPVRFKSMDGFKNADRFRSPDRPNRADRPLRFERSVRDLSLSDMSKYIRSTIRQICNEQPVVFQVCPKLKNRYNQHKKVCPNKSDRANEVMEDELDEDQDQASGSVISRLIQSLSGCVIPSTEQAGCQCTRTDCYCTKATQCVNNPDASTNTHSACSCKIPTKINCCRGMPCVCARKSQDQAYYNKRIDEEIAEWLKDVPVHSIEGSDSKKKRDTVIKELRKTLKQLPDDENYDENARNEIKSFIEDFPLWNPGKDRKDEKLFKNQLADKLTEKILSVPRKPDRFRDIVNKWVANMDFEDDGEEVNKEAIIDKFVNKLKSMAVDRPACDVKYTHTLRKEIIELLVELALKFDGDMVMLKKMANKLATEIVSIPRNVNLSGDTTDLTDEFEENVSDWICEHGLCGELKKDPKLIEGLARKLNKLKSQGIDDKCVVEKMKEEIHQFVDDVGIAIETIDELVDELMKQLSNTVQTNEMEKLNQDELTEVFTNWLSDLPGASDLHPRKFEKIIKELVKVIIEGKEQGNEKLANDILTYLVDADLGIDPADLGIHVEELMEKLNLLPSNKYHKEQIKKELIKDIFDIIENLSVSQSKKKVLRNKVHEIVENHLLRSLLNSKEAHDDMRDAIMEDMDDAISGIDIPKESRLKLKASLGNMLNSNFEKSFMRLTRLSREGSDLKQTIAKDIRNAVKELPIDTDKKKDLMQQVKGTLSKNMHKPLPSNVKNTINNEISDIVERCPISEDNSILGSLKKMLSAVASKHLNICVPKCVCDIQDQVQKAVGIVIDRSSIDSGKKKELKKNIQDILTENEDRQLSDEVLKSIKEDISGVVSDLSIPQDKKDVLKKTVGETISKDFNEALSNLRHDLNKIRNKLFDDICKIIEKSPIPRNVKAHLKNKLKSVLARNLDSSLSDEEKYTILDDVSNIVKDDMPEEKRRSLTNKLAKKLDTQQRKEDTIEIDELTEELNLKELEKKILEYILREMEQAVEEAPIPREKKNELKMKLKDMGTVDYKKPTEEIAEVLTGSINEILDKLNLPIDKKNELKSELAAAIDEYSKLLKELKDVGPEYIQLKRRSSTDANGKQKKNRNGLMPIEVFDKAKAKESILQGIEDIIEGSVIPEQKKMELKRKLKKMATDNLKKPLSDDVLDDIKISIGDILDELQIPKPEKDELKRALVNMADENVANLQDVDKTRAIESILQGIEKIIKESDIPEAKKMELKRKLKKFATDNLKKPFSDDVQDAIKTGIADILDELQAPTPEKNKLKRALKDMTNDYLDNLREAKRPMDAVDEKLAKESILQGIEDITEESAIPEEKKLELERKLKKMATDNLKKPFSDDVQDAIKIGIADILDELQAPTPEKNKLKRALMSMTDDYLDHLRAARQPVTGVDQTKAKESILKGIEKIIKESAIPEEKKMELKRKLKKIATDNLEKPFSDDVQDAIEIGIADILDELQASTPEKNKLKRALIDMTKDYLDNLRDAKRLMEAVDEKLAKESILQGIEDITEESAIPEEKKLELERKLKKMATDNLKKPFSDDVQDAIKIGIADILDELQAPTPEKNKLKRALLDMTKDYLDNLRDAKRPMEAVNEKLAKESILQGIEDITRKSAIPEEKKMELERKLKKMATDNLKKPFSDDVHDAIKIGIADILDELQAPTPEKNKLKRALMSMTDDYLDNLRAAKQPVTGVDQTKAKESILKGIEKIIKESAIPEEKKMELKRKLKKIASDNLEKPFSDDVQDAIEIGIADILDELQAYTPEKKKLKRALIDMTKDYLDNLRDAKRPIEAVDEKLAKESILQGIKDITEESAIPEEKKMELERTLKKMATDNLKKPFSDDVHDAIKIGIADILDELQAPTPEKNKLKRALMNMTDDYLDNVRAAKQPVTGVDQTKAKESILKGIEKIIKESAISEEKQMELKRKLKKIATDNLEKPFSDDVQDAIEIGIADILDELQASTPEKNKLKRALIDMTKDYLDNLRDAKRPMEAVDEKLAKESILQGIEDITEESAIPEEKKLELERKLKKMATDNLKKPFSDDVQDAIKIGIADILDELQAPTPEKNKLKLALMSMTDNYLDNLRAAKQPVTGVDQTKAKESILKEIEKIIKESAIPEEKKMELKRKLKEIATDNLEKPFSDDVQDAIEIGIADILDELQAPTPEKNKLKRALIDMTKDYLDNLRDAKRPMEAVDEKLAKESILQGFADITEESAIPEEKKLELERKLKKMATDNLKKPFSDDVQDAIKIGIADILDELQAPTPEKNKLKRALTSMTDDYLDNLRAAKQPVTGVDQTKVTESIAQGIEKIIAESAIPEEKKMGLERKLKKMAIDNFKKPSDDVQDAIKIGIADIIDELQIPKPEKYKLKRALMNMTDENVANLRDVDKAKAKESVLQGIESIIKDSAIPEETKMELKRNLKEMATDNLKKPFSDDVQDAIKIGITDILDELQIPKSDKNKLKRALMNMTDDYLDNLRAAKQPVKEVDQTKAKESILQAIEKIIAESTIPENKKMELKQKLKTMATHNLQKPFSDDVEDAIKIGIADLLDELQIPKAERNKLKHALINVTDENLAKLRSVPPKLSTVNDLKGLLSETQKNMLRRLEEAIYEAPIPTEKKKELKKKLNDMATKNFQKSLPGDVTESFETGIYEIIDELNLPIDKTNKLKSDASGPKIKATKTPVSQTKRDMVDDSVEDFRDTRQVKPLKGLMPIEEVDETNAKESILQGIEKIIAESAIPEEKKMELKRKLEKMATDNLKKPFSDDVEDAIKIGIADILDELQIPKSGKNKLKRALLNMVEENVDYLQDTKPVRHLKSQRPEGEIDGTKAKESILQGIDKIIEESAVPENKKMELKKKLNTMTADNLKKPFSDDVKDAIKMGMADILDDLQIPKLEKNTLKRALINMADENLADLPTPKLPNRKKMTETQKNMLLGLEKAIDEAPIPIGKKKHLKEKLRDLAAKNLQTSSYDFEESLKDGIHEIIRELNSPKGTKPPYAKTKSDASDSKIKKTRSPVSQKPLKGLMPIEEVDETNAKESILQGIDKIIEESAVPENKKMESKRKLTKMATDNLKKPFSDDVQDAMKIGIADILDKLQVPSSEKNKLKRALLNMVDENVDNIRGVPLKLSSQAFKELQNYTQNNILLGFEKAIDEAPIPIDKKKELKKKLKDTATKNFQKSLSDDTAEALKDGIDEILDELNLPKDKKNKLKSELTAAVDENLNNFKNEINLEKSVPDAKRNKLNIIIRRVLPQFDEAVDPSYQKQLAEEFDELLEIALTDGDFNDARRKLIKKLMREQNLSEKEASAPVDELIDRAREMALKEERYELDPSYVKTLEADINDLVDIALVDGDFEDARRKLIKKLMREQNLPQEEASGCADDLIGKAQKLALAAQAKDKSLLHKEALTKAVSDAVDQSTMSKPDKSDLKNKLLSKLKQHMDKKPHINKDDLESLKSEVLKDLKKMIDESSVPTAKKNELKSLLNEDLAKTVDEIMDHYDDEEGYTKDYTKALSKAVNKSPMRNLEKSYLKKELAKTFEGIMDELDEDKITKHKEAFTKAINDAVDQSTLSKPDKKSLRNKLLNKMEETVDESPNINDIGALKTEVLKDCKNLVDVSSIPMGQKEELKILLKEEIMNDYDDEEMEESPEYDEKISEYKEAFAEAIGAAVSESPDMDDYDEKAMEDKLKKYKEAFARAINHAVDQSTLSKPDKNNNKNKLLSKLNQTIDNSPNLNDIGALTAEVLKDSKNVVDVSPLPSDKKKELKLLLQQAMEDASKELMDDEEISGEAFAMFKDKIAETVKTWMDKLPIDLDPEVATAVANDIASDILDRQKYLQVHPEAVSSDKDEIENLKYQIFRRMKYLVDPKDMPPIMDGTEELYRMLMDLEPPPGFPKFGLREQSTSERRRRDPVPQDRMKSTSSALSGNINYSLKELIATSKSIRKQWSRNLDETVTKLPLPRNENCFLKEKLAIYDETGQINMLSTKSRAKEETSTVQGPKSKKHVTPKPAHVVPKPAQVVPKPAQVVPKPAQKNNKGKLSLRLSKIEKALTFNNTTKQKSPFTPKSNQGVDEKDFTKFAANTIKAWLEKVQLNIEPTAKNKIIEELTHDVVDRKKYIQIFGSTDPTQSDDLEYLKVQVHRRLNAFVPAEALKAIIVDTKVLLTKIDTVKMKVTPVNLTGVGLTGPKSQKTGKKQGIADILDIKAKATNTSVNGDEEEMEQELSNIEFSPGQTSTPEKQNDEPTAEEYKATVEKSIKTWIETMPIDLGPEAITDFIDELTNDIVDRKKYLQVQPDKTISKKEEFENLRFQVFKRLNKADPDACVTPDDEKVEELYKMIGEGQRKSLTPKQTEEFRTALNEEISRILDDYNICCDRRELHPSLANELTKLGKSNADQDEIVENMIETIKRLTYLSACVCDEEAEELAHKLLYRTKKLIARIQEKDRQASAGTPVKKKDFKEAVMKDIGDVFDDCPMSQEKRKLMESQLAEDYAKDLGIPLEDSNLTMDETGPETKKGNYGMSFNGLTNFIDTWLSSIHTDDDTKGEDEIKDIKTDLAYSLIHKIGEMNVDPEIFNDESLYEAVLRDELQNLLGDITISDDELQALKEDLIEKVLQAQHRAHDEIAGQAYKRKLRDAISKLLPDQQNLSKEEQATMETLKDQLADAYIDLHFSGDNENQRERLKKKIADEINNFCRDYLYSNPRAPLNSRTLNNNLYSALNKVPLPTGDSIRYEVEQARIREEINDWIKELPLQPQNPTEVLARNKLVYVLSKKLFDIEVDGDTDNELMKKEIVKFLNKMPLESGENLDALADKLIDKLKASEESRKYDASSNVTIDAFGNVSAASGGSGMDAPICPAYKPCSSSSPKVCRRSCPSQPKPFPPCSLSAEDRAYLDRIKRRACLSPNCVSSFMRNNKRDAGVGSRSVDAGSQTVLRPFGIETPQQSRICPVDNEKTPRPCPGVSANLLRPPCSYPRRDPFEIEKPPPSPICPAAHEHTSRPCSGRTSPQSGHQMRRHTISSSNIECPIEGEVQPQIIIKQYYWNPNEKNSMVSDLQQSGRSSRRQPDPAPCPQPGPVPCYQPSPAPCHQPGPAPCDQPRRSSYAQSTPAPYLSSLGKLQQQNTSPQRMPCDQSFTTPELKSQQQPSPERYSYWDPQSSFQKPSQRDTPSSRSSCTPSPCMSPFDLNQQSSPPCSPGFSKRDQECRIPKRDGLQDQKPCSSRPCRKERVVELGSLDDVPTARPKKRNSDQSDWQYTKFQDDNFWGVPMRRVILDEGIDESVVMEREQREERIRCRCKERLMPKSGRFQARTCPSREIPHGNDDEQNLKRCSKCCGRHCPYPSFFYFRQ